MTSKRRKEGNLYKSVHPRLKSDFGKIEGLPDWLGGKKGAIYDIWRKATKAAAHQYQPYGGQRISPRTDLQRSAATQLQNLIDQQQQSNIPQHAQNHLQQAAQQNILQATQPYLNQNVNPLALRQEYANPYQQQMIQTLRNESQQHLLEDILPRINASYIKGFHSSGRNKFTQKAI